MIPVAALYRVSTARQVKKEEEDSIPLQAKAIREFVASHPDWELVAEYAEEGVSAFKYSKDDRDVLRSVIADALSGKFKILLVFKSDRLSRKSLEYPLVLWQLQVAGVEVISVADAPGGKKLELKDQYDKLLRFIEGWQSETESVNTRIRVSHVMRQMAEQGKWTGGRPPYGFRLSDSKKGLPLEIDEREAAVLREMCRLYLEEGLGSKRIATILNERGLRTREGKLWSDSSVRRVLQNPIICGLPAYNRTKPGNTPTSRVRIRGYTDLDNFIIPRDAEGNPAPVPEYVIIPLEVWRRLIAKMQENDPNRDKKKDIVHLSPSARALESGALLTGFLVCGHCGRGFISSGCNQMKRRGKVYPYRRRVYRCVTHARVGGGEKLCNGQGSYSQKKVDAVFLEELRNFLSGINAGELLKYVERRRADYLADISTKIKALEAELKKNKRVYEAWVKRLDEYFADPASSLYTEELLAGKVREYKEIIDSLEEELGELRKQARTEDSRKEQLLEFSRRAPEWLNLFMEAPVPVKKRMLAQIISKVVLYRDKMEIHYCVDLAEFLGRNRTVEEEERFELRVLARF
ncbi:recombinase family protein [Desulfovirgula thermocuniculi]|uniref:recombinase family protein n=1 Tax=Desulfovirgula thermocuniculi TaxID=348842 RepID=UPI0003FECD8A|nr:recombinase family protein [Desulfovirgula thermocuniculi]